MSLTHGCAQPGLLCLLLFICCSGCAKNADIHTPSTLFSSPSQTIESIEFDQGTHHSYSYKNGSLTEERFSNTYGKLIFQFDTTPVNNLLGFKKTTNAKHRISFQSTDQKNVTVVWTDRMTCLYHDGLIDDQSDIRMNQVCLEHATDAVHASRHDPAQGENLPRSIRNNVEDSSFWTMLQDFRINIESAFKETSKFITHQRLAKYVEKELKTKLGEETLAEALNKMPCPLFCDNKQSDTSITLFVKSSYTTTVVSVRSKNLLLTAAYQIGDKELSNITGDYRGMYNTLAFDYSHAPDGEGIRLSDEPFSKRSYKLTSKTSHGSDPALSGKSPDKGFRRYCTYATFPDVYGKITNQITIDNPGSRWLSPVGMSQIFMEILRQIEDIASRKEYLASQNSRLVDPAEYSSFNIKVLPFETLEQKDVQRYYNIPWQLHRKAKNMMKEEVDRKIKIHQPT